MHGARRKVGEERNIRVRSPFSRGKSVKISHALLSSHKKRINIPVLLGRGRPFLNVVYALTDSARSLIKDILVRGVRPKLAGLLHGSVLRLGLRERNASRVVGQVRPPVGGNGVGGSRVLGSEAETPPLAEAVCVWGKPILVLDVRRDVRAWHAGEADI